MDPFARIVVGYHGSKSDSARELLLGKLPFPMATSTNEWDGSVTDLFLGASPERALRWARSRFSRAASGRPFLGATSNSGGVLTAQ